MTTNRLTPPSTRVNTNRRLPGTARVIRMPVYSHVPGAHPGGSHELGFLVGIQPERSVAGWRAQQDAGIR